MEERELDPPSYKYDEAVGWVAARNAANTGPTENETNVAGQFDDAQTTESYNEISIEADICQPPVQIAIQPGQDA